jgi:hypothetical protein
MPDPEARGRPVRLTFTTEYKLRIVEEANAAREMEISCPSRRKSPWPLTRLHGMAGRPPPPASRL